MIDEDIVVGRRAFGQRIEILSRIEEQSLYVHEEISILRQLTSTAIEISSTECQSRVESIALQISRVLDRDAATRPETRLDV